MEAPVRERVNRSPSGQVRPSPLLWHRKSCPRFGGSTILTSVISGLFDKNCLGALDGSLGFLLGGLGGSLGLTSGALGCSSVFVGVLLASFWVLLRPSLPPIKCPVVFRNDVQTTFASQTSIFRTCFYSQRNIAVFDTRLMGLGAENRPEEGSQGVKRPVRRALTEMRRDEKQSIVPRQIELIIVNVF